MEDIHNELPQVLSILQVVDPLLEDGDLYLHLERFDAVSKLRSRTCDPFDSTLELPVLLVPLRRLLHSANCAARSAIPAAGV